MKRFLLMMTLIPCLVIAQKMPEREKQLSRKWLQNQQSALRSDELVTLDSIYNYTDKPGRLSHISRFTNDEMSRPEIEMREYYTQEQEPGGLFSKIEYAYKGNIKEPAVETYYLQNEGKWVPSRKYETDFNEFGKLAETRAYRYNEGEWTLDERTTVIEFDGAGNFSVAIDSIFEGGELQIMKLEFTYTGDNKMASADFHFWEAETEEWVHLQNNILMYDDHQNLLHDSARDKYDTEEWSPYYDIFYTYDERNNLIEEYEISHDDFSDSHFYNRFQNFYSDNLVTANQKIGQSGNLLISIDSSKQLIIDSGTALNSRMTVINITGKQIYQTRLTGGVNTLSLESVPAGLYIIRVDTPEGFKTRKIVLQ